MYGKELVIDLYTCDVSLFGREGLNAYIIELCDNVIHMKRADLHWWDYEDDPEGYEKAPAHLKGVSAVQFIETSSIVIHTIDDKGLIMINIFSCMDYNSGETVEFTAKYFSAESFDYSSIRRGVFYERKTIPRP